MLTLVERTTRCSQNIFKMNWAVQQLFHPEKSRKIGGSMFGPFHCTMWFRIQKPATAHIWTQPSIWVDALVWFVGKLVSVVPKVHVYEHDIFLPAMSSSNKIASQHIRPKLQPKIQETLLLKTLSLSMSTWRCLAFFDTPVNNDSRKHLSSSPTDTWISVVDHRASHWFFDVFCKSLWILTLHLSDLRRYPMVTESEEVSLKYWKTNTSHWKNSPCFCLFLSGAKFKYIRTFVVPWF